jgi:hypothetical protein
MNIHSQHVWSELVESPTNIRFPWRLYNCRRCGVRFFHFYQQDPSLDAALTIMAVPLTCSKRDIIKEFIL